MVFIKRDKVKVNLQQLCCILVLVAFVFISNMTENTSNILLKNRIPIYVDSDKNTSFHYAAARGDFEKVKKEIEDKNEIDPVNYMGWTPLMMATRCGHSEIVKYLLENHADSTRSNCFGFNILLMAIASGRLNILQLILQYLLSGGVSKQSIQRTFSPISLAILFSNIQMMQYLISKGFCINIATRETEITPMMFAMAMGNTDIIEFLRRKGAKYNKNNEKIVYNNVQPDQQPNSKTYVNGPPPLLLYSPNHYTPQFLNVPYNPLISTKSSDLLSPRFTSEISPFSAGPVVHQIFFSPNFSPAQFVSPINAYPVFNNDVDFLNMRIMHPTPCYSPMFHNSAY